MAKQNDIGTNMQGIGRLVQELSKKQIINQQQSSIIKDMIGLLNEAVHGAKIDVRSAQWAIEVGPKLLRYFDEISK